MFPFDSWSSSVLTSVEEVVHHEAEQLELALIRVASRVDQHDLRKRLEQVSHFVRL